MKKVLFIMLALLSMQFMYAQQTNIDVDKENIEESILQANAANINVTLNGGYAQEEYHLEYSPLIPGARLEWSIRAPQAYITPWTNHCSVSFYAVGGARLVCDIYDGNTWVGAGTTYINIR